MNNSDRKKPSRRFANCGDKKIVREKSIAKILINRGISVVLIGHYINEVPGVNIDNCLGGEIATNYLIKLGFKNIAIITGPDISERRDSQEKLKGYKEAMGSSSLKVDPAYIVDGNFTYESGYNRMVDLLNLGNKPQAIFACDDQMALGAISAANDENLKVPDDISIIGFDDIVQVKFSSPRLTTIRQPKNKMGLASAELLINLVENKQIDNENKIFEPELIERDSCKI